MTIEICSRDAAILLAAGAREETAVVSIASTDEKEAVFPENEHLTALLRLTFNDLTEAYDPEGLPYGRPLPQAEDFAALPGFLQALRCQRLIVHCWEGASRSAAVAAAIYEFRGCKDSLRTHGRFSPNSRVYALACRALDLSPGPLRYRAVPDGGAWTLERAI